MEVVKNCLSMVDVSYFAGKCVIVANTKGTVQYYTRFTIVKILTVEIGQKIPNSNELFFFLFLKNNLLGKFISPSLFVCPSVLE